MTSFNAVLALITWCLASLALGLYIGRVIQHAEREENKSRS